MSVQPTSETADDRVLELRSQGRSFAGIAKELGLERAQLATDAFNRALRRRPEDERSRLAAEENGRLDMLADRVRSNDSLDEQAVAERLRVIESMRQALAS